MNKKIKFYTIIFLIFLVSIEFISFLTISLLTKKFFSFSRIKEINSEKNMFIKDLTDKKKCNYQDFLFPHPYLGYVHWNNPKCKIKESEKINDTGFFGPDYPLIKNKDKFDILIVGGSVAAQFGPMFKCNKISKDNCNNFIQDKLKYYTDLKNRDIRVFNGAAGAYKQPQQLIVSQMYGQVFDLVISIEGFNEHYIFLDNKKTFDYPSSNFNYVNNHFLDSKYTERIVYKLNNFTKSLSHHFSFLNYSYSYNFFYFCLKKISYRLLFGNAKLKNYLWNQKLEQGFKDTKKLNSNKYLKYFNYLDTMDYYMKLNSGNAVIFFQPALFNEKKKLSQKEKQNFNTILKVPERQEVYKNYLKIINSRDAKNGAKIYSMIDIFKDIDEEVYTDTVHVNKKGNLIFAEFIINKLLEDNFIKKK